MTTTFKTGKKPAVDRPKDFLFTKYRAAASPIVVPPVFGHGKAFTDWGVLGNDNYGNCVWAGADHEHMLLNQLAAGTGPNTCPIAFSANTALADYASTGFVLDDPNTDQGTDTGQALEYRRNHGIVDVKGKRHYIGAYVRLTPGNIAHLLEALYLFEIVGFGFRFPNYAMDQFNNGQPWDISRSGDQTVDGAHYVSVVGRSAPGWIDTVSWGRTQRMSEAFVSMFCDEAYGIISNEGLRARVATNTAGFNWQQLGADAGVVGVLSNPLPPGPMPPPSPAPPPVVRPPAPVPAPPSPPLPFCLSTRLKARKLKRRIKRWTGTS